MKRVIVDYANSHSELLSRIDELYAPSYQFDKLITFKSSDGKTKKCIEIKLNDTIYLVKMDRFLDFDNDENDDYDGPIPE